MSVVHEKIHGFAKSCRCKVDQKCIYLRKGHLRPEAHVENKEKGKRLQFELIKMGRENEICAKNQTELGKNDTHIIGHYLGKEECTTETDFWNMMNCYQGGCMQDFVKRSAEVFLQLRCQMDLAYFWGYDCSISSYLPTSLNYLISSCCNNNPPNPDLPSKSPEEGSTASQCPSASASLLPTSMSTSQLYYLPHHLHNLLL